MTLVWAPAEWDLGTVGERVERAQASYMAQVKRRHDGDAADPAAGFNFYGVLPDAKFYAARPDMTVREVQAEYDREKAKWQERKAARSREVATFTEHLREQGLVAFWRHAGSLPTWTVVWGHHHGWGVAEKVEYTRSQDVIGPGGRPDSWGSTGVLVPWAEVDDD